MEPVHVQDKEFSLQWNMIEEHSRVSETCSVPKISTKHNNIAKRGHDFIGQVMEVYNLYYIHIQNVASLITYTQKMEVVVRNDGNHLPNYKVFLEIECLYSVLLI